jgi:hypothetical protein
MNVDNDGLSPAQLLGLYRCKIPSGKLFDVALVRWLEPSNWKPRTSWEGCQVFEKKKDTAFVGLEYVIRGALFSPAFGVTKKDSLRYLVDTVDYDMFLRANGLSYQAT